MYYIPRLYVRLPHYKTLNVVTFLYVSFCYGRKLLFQFSASF